jgi:hypothetical protein
MKSFLNIKASANPILGWFCLVITLLMGASCNEDFPNTLKKNYAVDSISANNKVKKVLYIILDGVKGNTLQEINPPAISQIVKRSIYNYDGVADSETGAISNETAWTTLTTGVVRNKHKVTGTSFAGNDLVTYPTLFKRLKASKPTLRTASFAASASFNDNLAVDATLATSFGNDDAQVKNAVVNELNRPDAGLLVAQFHSAEVAGVASGYTAGTPAYAAVINTLDGYVGEIITALQARATFKDENWLVVITSNKGGTFPIDNTATNAFEDANRNNFTIFYNPRFASQFVPKPDVNAFPYGGFAPRFQASTSSNGVAKLSNTAIGNFGSSGEFTLTFKIRHDSSNGLYYPMFLGKREPFNSVSSNGWGFLFGADGYQLDWAGGPRPGGRSIRDGIWHTISFKMANVAGVRTLSLYTDGQFEPQSASVTENMKINTRNIDNTAALRIGSDLAGDGNGATNILIKDLAIYNIAMSDADLAANVRKEILPTSPYFANLIGWWPGNEKTGTILNDRSGKGNNFTANANMTWDIFEDISPNISPEVGQSSYKVVINGVDIPYQIYNWFDLPVSSTWSLDGKVWKPTYRDVTNQ